MCRTRASTRAARAAERTSGQPIGAGLQWPKDLFIILFYPSMPRLDITDKQISQERFRQSNLSPSVFDFCSFHSLLPPCVLVQPRPKDGEVTEETADAPSQPCARPRLALTQGSRICVRLVLKIRSSPSDHSESKSIYFITVPMPQNANLSCRWRALTLQSENGPV